LPLAPFFKVLCGVLALKPQRSSVKKKKKERKKERKKRREEKRREEKRREKKRKEKKRKEKRKEKKRKEKKQRKKEQHRSPARPLIAIWTSDINTACGRIDHRGLLIPSRK
jgi:alpha-galactosidase/6-phospho-beta-glucosidase family protein